MWSAPATDPGKRRQVRRLLLVGLVFTVPAIFVGWTIFQQARSARNSPPPPPVYSVGDDFRQPESHLRSTPRAFPDRASPVLPGQQHVLNYGGGEGELGMVREPGQPPVGPESFAVGKDGSILVADVVNQRVVVYSSNGSYLRSLSLPGIALGDVMADDQGRVYVYDQVRRALHQYDPDGTPRSTLELTPKDIDTRGYFHLTGNAVFFADAAARDVLVAVVRDGVLVAPDPNTQRKVDGIHAPSERVYFLSLDRGRALHLRVVEAPMAMSDALTLEVPWAGIVSARYVGEDNAGRFYVQTERLEDTRIVLEVLSFEPGGELLAATRMPENDYALWTAKLVDVRADGTIVQFLPQRGQAKLNLFTN